MWGGRTTPSCPLYRAVFHRKTYICENRALQQILYSSECHFVRKSVFGCFQERAWVFVFLFLQWVTTAEALLLFCLLCSGIDSFTLYYLKNCECECWPCVSWNKLNFMENSNDFYLPESFAVEIQLILLLGWRQLLRFVVANLNCLVCLPLKHNWCFHIWNIYLPLFCCLQELQISEDETMKSKQSE